MACIRQCDLCGRCRHDNPDMRIGAYKVKRVSSFMFDTWTTTLDVCNDCAGELYRAAKEKKP